MKNEVRIDVEEVKRLSGDLAQTMLEKKRRLQVDKTQESITYKSNSSSICFSTRLQTLTVFGRDPGLPQAHILFPSAYHSEIAFFNYQMKDPESFFRGKIKQIRGL